MVLRVSETRFARTSRPQGEGGAAERLQAIDEGGSDVFFGFGRIFLPVLTGSDCASTIYLFWPCLM